MAENTSKKETEREIEGLLKTAEGYLWKAKVNKSKNLQNFEVALALEYVTKARDKAKQLMHVKEFCENANRKADFLLMNSPSYRLLFLIEKAKMKWSMKKEMLVGANREPY
jgi:hypothetical protein